MDNLIMIRIAAGLLGIFVPIMLFLLFLLRKQMEYRETYSIFLKDKKVDRDYWYVLYDLLSRVILIRVYLKSLTGRYAILYPGEERLIEKKAIKLAVKLWYIDIAIVTIVFLFGESWYYLWLAIFYLYVAGNGIVFWEEGREREKLLEQFDIFLCEVSENYQSHEILDEAVYEAMQDTDKPLKLHAGCILDILTSSESDRKKEAYLSCVPDKFIKTFLALCLIINTYGDTKTAEGRSLFLANIAHLRQEIHLEVLKRSKIQYLFSGLTFVTVLPVLFLKAIEKWAVNSLPQLINFYSGTAGILLMAVIFLITFFSYQLLLTLREERKPSQREAVLLEALEKQENIRQMLDSYQYRYYGKLLNKQEFLKLHGEKLGVRQFILKSMLFSIAGFLICILLSFGIHNANRKLELTRSINYSDSTISEEKGRTLSSEVINITHRSLGRNITLEEILKVIKKEEKIKEKSLQRIAAEDIYARLKAIKNEYFKWYELLAAFLAAWGSYYIPSLRLLLLKKVRQRDMEDEVFSFQSIIVILRNIKRADTDIVIEWMEEFSYIFQSSIRECSRNLCMDERQALEELKEKEPFRPFCKIVDGLQSSDKLGLYKAFEDVEQERNNYINKRALDNEISIQDKTILGRTIAFVPFVLTVGLYLILPFVAEGLRMYKVYMEQINGIGG
ncbi:hypothetical protein R2R35_20285 [Anaerocolumna sp. AGMB13020]|uniref:hypothetical protein n=1 Tax=Anaerocolumna sp. AGMB13020 TaxID=3081750 RepID=UPI00295457D7|nr:hypothetical protein [Anaerocolumna sp. AGMB13020]WOO36113.1 hypothetical protein R2R35_20285 [Anaerocolumna sp. AGMB13020]